MSLLVHKLSILSSLDSSYPYVCKTTVQCLNKNVVVVKDYTNYVLEGIQML